MASANPVDVNTSNSAGEEVKGSPGGGEAPSNSNSTICEVCQVKDSRYKCPACYLKYCTAKCFTTHKRNDHDLCDARRHARMATAQTPGFSGGKPTIPEKVFASDFWYRTTGEVERTIQGRAYRRMTKLLRKPHVREMIRMLDSCDDPRTQVPICFQDPDFAKYARFMARFVGNEDFNEPDSDSSENEYE